MKQFLKTIEKSTNGQKLIEITNEVVNFVQSSNIKNGFIHLSILHTSASLLVQENADPNVLKDLMSFFEKIVPMDFRLYKHKSEGRDDMPAHIKTALTQTHLTLSINDSSLVLGTWQGVYLFEHRLHPHSRKILIHIIGE